MKEESKMSMMLCAGLEPAEQEKVERLDGPISEKFILAGCDVRICQGRTDRDRRLLDFRGLKGTVASIPANTFLAATDDEAVEMIARSNS